MCSLCGLSVAKNTILGKFSDLGVFYTDILLPPRVKFSVLEQTQGLHLPAKFHLTVFIVSASGGQKPQFWANFDNCGGSCTDLLLPQHTLICQISPRSVYSVATWWQKHQIFAIFSTSAFSGVASWQQSKNVEHGCTTTNVFLSNGIKIVSVLQRLHGEIWRRNSDVQKRDG